MGPFRFGTCRRGSRLAGDVGGARAVAWVYGGTPSSTPGTRPCDLSIHTSAMRSVWWQCVFGPAGISTAARPLATRLIAASSTPNSAGFPSSAKLTARTGAPGQEMSRICSQLPHEGHEALLFSHRRHHGAVEVGAELLELAEVLHGVHGPLRTEDPLHAKTAQRDRVDAAAV